MKELVREKIQPILVRPGDTISLTYAEKAAEEKEVLSYRIKRKMTLDEAVIFSVEKGDFDKVKGGIGGAFLESDKEL